MIRPGDYEDRALFVDHDGVWQQKRGASAGVLEPVPEPWLERFFLRWFPHLALRRRQARVGAGPAWRPRATGTRTGSTVRSLVGHQRQPRGPAGAPAAGLGVSLATGGW